MANAIPNTDPDHEIIQHFGAPRPIIRRITERLLAVVLILAVLAVVGQLILAFMIGPFMVGSAVLTAILIIPLLLRTVLHPEISQYADGLTVQPMLWPAQHVPWHALTNIVPHPLVYNDEATGRLMHGKRWRPREGAVIVVRRKRDGGPTLSPLYRLVGQLAGTGDVAAFAVSSTTHRDYDTLIQVLREHTPPSATPTGAASNDNPGGE